MTILLGSAKAAGGTTEYSIQLLNEADTACSLYGFPGVAFFGKNPSVQVGPTATRNFSSPERLITLAPNGWAKAVISIVNAKNYPKACRQTAVSGLLVRAPGRPDLMRLALDGVTCANPKYHVLSVDALVPGPPVAPGA